MARNASPGLYLRFANVFQSVLAVFFVRSGSKPIEFEKGKNAIAVSSLDKISLVIDILITAVRNGELDDQLAQRKKPPTTARSANAGAKSTGREPMSVPLADEAQGLMVRHRSNQAERTPFSDSEWPQLWFLNRPAPDRSAAAASVTAGCSAGAPECRRSLQ